MSGSFKITFLEPEFVYHYEDNFRKIFKDEDQSRDFFEEKTIISRKAFLSFLPAFETFLKEAKERGILLSKIDLAKTIDFDAIDYKLEIKQSPEGIIHLNLNRSLDDGGANFIELYSSEVVSKENIEWLINRVGEFNYLSFLKDKQKIIESVPKESLDVFKSSLHEIKYSEKFSVATSLLFNMRAIHEVEFRKSLVVLLDRVYPALETLFKNKEKLKLFFDDESYEKLISYKEKFGQVEEQNTAEHFNVYGPALDEFGTRMSINVGLMKVTVLFLFSDNTSVFPNQSFTLWLQRVASGRDLWEAELMSLFKKAEDFSNEELQQKALEELASIGRDEALQDVGGREIINFLITHAKSEEKGEKTMRIMALRKLQWLKRDIVKQFFIDCIRERKIEGAMSIIGQALAEYMDQESADVLIDLLGDASVPDDDKTWAKYGLKQMDVYLKDPNKQPLKQKIAPYIQS